MQWVLIFMMIFVLEKIISLLVVIFPVLVAVAFLTLAERKIMASIQQRQGPNTIGFIGLLQPAADAVKLMLKEAVIPTNAHTFGFIVAPLLSLFLSLSSWSAIPFTKVSYFVNLDLGVLFLFAVSSLGVYGVIISG